MNLKTSFFNKTVIKSDIRRFWWISALHGVILFLFGIFNFLNDIEYRSDNLYQEITNYTHSYLFNYLFVFYFMAIVVPAILGVFLFSYLHSGKMSAFAHSIPVRRQTHYISHIVSGIILSIAPVIVNALILIAMKLSPIISETFRVSHLMYIVLGTLLYSLITFSLSVFVSTIVANSVSALIFTLVFAVLPLIAEAFCKFFISTQLYGFEPSSDSMFFEFLYILPERLLEGANPAIYIVLSLILLGSGYALYRKRNLEINSEIVAFASLRPVFIYGAAIACGCVGFSYFNAMVDTTSALALIPFGILGIIIATMIVRKSFRVFKASLKPLIAYTILVAALFVVTEFDVTGYESRIPSPENVESVVFDIDSIRYNYHWREYDSNGKKIIPMHEFKPILSASKDIENVAKLHKTLLDDRTEYRNDTIHITYNLKNGKTLRRTYPVSYDGNEYLEAIIESDVIRKAYFPLLRDDKRTIISLDVDYPANIPHYQKDDAKSSVVPGTITITDPEQISVVTEAMKTDLQSVDYSEYASRMDGTIECYINVNFKMPYVYETGNPVPESSLFIQNETYYIRSSYVNTLDALSQITALTE